MRSILREFPRFEVWFRLNMPGFTVHEGTAALLNGDDIDTDRIIPARFLTMVTRSGYGELAFCDVRGPDFPLDQAAAKDATILIVGTNFGCGSSREHAVWAIQQAGLQVVIGKKTAQSPAFSDIFRGNASNCGLALIDLEEADHQKLAEGGNGQTVSVDLPNQTVRCSGGTFSFEIAPAIKNQLLQGLDLVGMTLAHEAEIGDYESRQPAYLIPASGN